MSRPDEDAALIELLKRQAGAEEPRPAGGPFCGDPELLAAYSEGSLGGTALDEYQRHLAACIACREAVARLVRLAPREGQAEAARPRAAWIFRWAWTAPVLAGFALVGSLAWFGRERIIAPNVALNEKPTMASPAPAASPAPSPLPPETVKEPAPAIAEDRAAKPATPPSEEQPKSKLASKDESERSANVGAVGPALADRKGADAPVAEKERDALKAAEAVSIPAQQQAPASRAEPISGVRQRADQQVQVLDQAAQKQQQAQQQQPAFAPAPAAPAASQEARGQYGATTATARRENVRVETLAKKAAFRAVRSCNVTPDGRLRLSLDGGQMWRFVAAPEVVESCNVNEDTSLEIRARSGVIYRSKDDGRTWERFKKD